MLIQFLLPVIDTGDYSVAIHNKILLTVGLSAFLMAGGGAS